MRLWKGFVVTEPHEHEKLPNLIEEYLGAAIRQIRNRRVREDVLAELRAHFTDPLADVGADDVKVRAEVAEALIAQFGDVKLLARLINRAKKRCRPLWVKSDTIVAQCEACPAVLKWETRRSAARAL